MVLAPTRVFEAFFLNPGGDQPVLFESPGGDRVTAWFIALLGVWNSMRCAWLSSARVVRCWVKSRNERNPCLVLPARYGGDSRETAGVNSEEGGDDVKSSCPLCPGLHTCYNGRYSGLLHREVVLIP